MNDHCDSDCTAHERSLASADVRSSQAVDRGGGLQLRKLMSQAVQSQKQLSIVKTQIQSKEQERKILTLTQRELSAVPERTRGEETRMYKGVGKM